VQKTPSLWASITSFNVAFLKDRNVIEIISLLIDDMRITVEDFFPYASLDFLQRNP
jgi:hypothetical protein